MLRYQHLASGATKLTLAPMAVKQYFSDLLYGARVWERGSKEVQIRNHKTKKGSPHV